MLRILILALTLMLLSSLFGCGGGVKKDDLVGDWSGTAVMSYEAMQKDAGGDNEQSRFLAAQEGEFKTIKLTLNADGTAVFVNERTVNGTWTLAGDTVTLELPLDAGTEEGKWFGGRYLLKLDGKEYMEGNDPSVEGFKVKFKR